MTFSERLKLLRENAGLTQSYMAEKIGVKRPTYAGYETKGTQPSYDILQEIANFFNVSVDYLLGATDIKNKPDDILKGEYHKDFENIDEVLKFLLQDNTVMAFGGFDTNKLTDDEIIELANALKSQIELLGLKYKR